MHQTDSEMKENDINVGRAVADMLKTYFAARPGLAIAILLLLFLTPLQDVLLPHLVGKIVSTVKQSSRSSSSGLDKEGMTRAVLVLLIAIVILQLGFGISDYLDARLYPSLQNHVRSSMVSCLLARFQEHGTLDPNTGEIESMLLKVPFTLVFCVEAVKAMLPHLLVFVAAAAYFYWMDRLLGVCMTVTLAATLLALWTAVRFCSVVSCNRDRQLNLVHEAIDDMFRNLPVVLTMPNARESEMQRIRVAEQDFERQYHASVMCGMKVKACVAPLILVMTGIALWRCRVLLLRRELDVGRLVSIILVIMYILNSMMRMVATSKSMVHHWGILQASREAFTHCSFPYSSTEPAAEGQGIIPATTGFGARAVTYPPVFAAAAAVDLHVAPGTRLALMGRIGAGKSTLLKLFAGILRPASGLLYLDGVPYDYSVEGRRIHQSYFAYVHQHPVLFDRSVYDNIVMNQDPERWTPARVLRLADAYGAGAVLRRLPRGLWTRAGKGGGALSGGQRQIVCLLRALVQEPRALLLDEPSSALDDDTQRIVEDIIVKCGLTCVISTHDKSLAEAVATHVVYLQ